jgi:hypothetical protein
MTNPEAVREIQSLKNKFETQIENLCLEVDDVDACELIEEAHQSINSILASLKEDLNYLELNS